MTEKNLEIVNDRLAKLHGYAYFRPGDGPLRERLTEAVLDAVTGDAAEELGERSFDLEVNIGRQEGDEGVSVGFSVDHPGVEYRSQVALDALTEVELQDLASYLMSPEAEDAPGSDAASAAKTLVRRKHDDPDFLEQAPAAVRLKVSPEWLKSVIPCTEYTYEEIEGKKYIRDYYWSRELIERLFKIRSTKTTPEDLQYVAKECCEGDTEWARDLIGRLKSPNRPEPAPKEQSQKGQGRSATVKTVSAKQSGGRPAQPKSGSARPQQGNAPAANAAPAAVAAAPGERTRARSRHKRPFRDQNKEGSRKPDPGAGQKHPQQH